MKKIMKIVLIAGVFQLSGVAQAAYTGPNRIKKPTEDRCLYYFHMHLTLEKAKLFRKDALEEGCISQEEYEFAEAWLVVPGCQDLGNGLELTFQCEI